MQDLLSLSQLLPLRLLSRVYFSQCPTNGKLAHRLRIMMKMVRGSHDDVNDDDDDHHHDDQ